MKIFFSLVCTAVLFATPCYGGGKPEQNGIVFTGVSDKLSYSDDSIEAALQDAARRFSFFNSINGYVVYRERIGDRSLDYQITADYHLEYDDDFEKYINQMEFNPATDVFENNNAVFVNARAKSAIPMPQYRGHSSGETRPRWIDFPPAKVSGFTAGVGFSARLNSYKDTVIASYENALVTIIENANTHILGKNIFYNNTGSAFGTYAGTDYIAVSSGTLKHFYVVESWTDPDSLAVWTLAVASAANANEGGK